MENIYIQIQYNNNVIYLNWICLFYNIDYLFQFWFYCGKSYTLTNPLASIFTFPMDTFFLQVIFHGNRTPRIIETSEIV